MNKATREMICDSIYCSLRIRLAAGLWLAGQGLFQYPLRGKTYPMIRYISEENNVHCLEQPTNTRHR